MVYQYYIYEIIQNPDGEYEDYKHFVYDQDADMARLKAESKFHEVLSVAAVSNTLKHSAIIVSDEAFPVDNKCYKHPNAQPEPTPEPETEE